MIKSMNTRNGCFSLLIFGPETDECTYTTDLQLFDAACKLHGTPGLFHLKNKSKIWEEGHPRNFSTYFVSQQHRRPVFVWRSLNITHVILHPDLMASPNVTLTLLSLLADSSIHSPVAELLTIVSQLLRFLFNWITCL